MGRISYVNIRGSNLKFGYPLGELIENLNADLVDGYHVSLEPAPNVIVPLNEEGYLDLSNTTAKINAYSFKRVNLSDATEDYELRKGEEAIIDFTNASSVPLHIATYDNTYYEFILATSNTGGTSGAVDNPIFLYPNNTTYSNAFRLAIFYRTSSGGGSAYKTFSAFQIGRCFGSIHCFIFNKTVYKNVKGFFDLYGKSTVYPGLSCFSTDWRDNSTPWTSLGSIIFPQLSSGRILVRRLE